MLLSYLYTKASCHCLHANDISHWLVVKDLYLSFVEVLYFVLFSCFLLLF